MNPTALRAALGLFRKANFSQAVQALERLEVPNTNNTLHFLSLCILGHSYHKLGQERKALSAFVKCARLHPIGYTKVAQWLGEKASFTEAASDRLSLLGHGWLAANVAVQQTQLMECTNVASTAKKENDSQIQNVDLQLQAQLDINVIENLEMKVQSDFQLDSSQIKETRGMLGWRLVRTRTGLDGVVPVSIPKGTGDWAKAISCLELNTSADNDKSNTNLHLIKSMVLHDLQEGKSTVCKGMLADFYQDVGEYETARALLQELWNEDQDVAIGLGLVHVCLLCSESSDRVWTNYAMRVLDQIQSVDNSPAYFVLRARCLYRLERVKEASEMLVQGRNVDGSWLEFWQGHPLRPILAVGKVEHGFDLMRQSSCHM